MLFRAPEFKIGLENDNVWIDICKEYARDGHEDL